jgi:NAD(P)-dependent dehydrogenase (short-subunit alcohol dehydrogenase family)
VSLAGTTAVVTGASRGIGRSIALRLAQAGAEVALWARDGNALNAVAAEITAAGGRAYPFIVDVTDPAAIERAADTMRGQLPPVRVLVNNAGAVLRKWTVTITDAEWRRVMATNLDGTFLVTRTFLSDLTRGGGRVINIASRSGREGTAMLSAYCAAKHGVVGFTRALAVELRAAKVQVNAICPGSVDTAMLKEGLPGAKPDMSPDDIASTALYLALPPPEGAPDALTGTCIDVYG